MNHNRIKSIIHGAQKGNPHKMVELAKMYKAGLFGDEKIYYYVSWLEKFFRSPIVGRIIDEMQEKYSETGQEPSEVSSHSFTIDPFAEYVIRQDIIDAGLLLGVYYKNSTKISELEQAQSYLISALDASAWNYLEVQNEPGRTTSVLSLVSNQIQHRIQKLRDGLNKNDG